MRATAERKKVETLQNAATPGSTFLFFTVAINIARYISTTIFEAWTQCNPKQACPRPLGLAKNEVRVYTAKQSSCCRDEGSLSERLLQRPDIPCSATVDNAKQECVMW